MDEQELIDKLQAIATEKLHDIITAALNSGATYDVRARLEVGGLHEVDITLRGGKHENEE